MEAYEIEEHFDLVRVGVLSRDDEPRLLTGLRDLLRRHAPPPDVPDPLSNL